MFYHLDRYAASIIARLRGCGVAEDRIREDLRFDVVERQGELVATCNLSDILDDAAADGEGLEVSLGRQAPGEICRNLASARKSHVAEGRPGRTACVEFASVYPTAPYPLADIRVAFVGDAIANQLQQDGWKVTREFFSNDAGQQVLTFSRAIYACYAAGFDQATAAALKVPDYIRGIARQLQAERGRDLLDLSEDEWLPPVRTFALDRILGRIRGDLASLGVMMDSFVSEQGLRNDGRLEAAVAQMLGHAVEDAPVGADAPNAKLSIAAGIAETEHQLVLRSETGEWTYLAADIAYHFYKVSRGFQRVVNVMRRDHEAYFQKLEAVIDPLLPPDVELFHRTIGAVQVVPDCRRGTAGLAEVTSHCDPVALRLSMLLCGDEDLSPEASVEGLCGPDMAGLVATLGASIEPPGEGEGVFDLPVLTHLMAWPLWRRHAVETNDPHRIALFLQSFANLHIATQDEAVLSEPCLADRGALAKIVRDACNHIGLFDPVFRAVGQTH